MINLVLYNIKPKPQNHEIRGLDVLQLLRHTQSLVKLMEREDI